MDQDHPQEKEIKKKEKTNKQKTNKTKWLFEDALQIAMNIRETKSKGEKERYTHLNTEFQRITRRDKKVFLSDQCKEIEENNRKRKSRDLLAWHHAINAVLSFTTIRGQLIDFAMCWVSRPQSMFTNTSR